MRESKIEKKLKDEAKRIGALCVKLVPTFHSGLPDRMVLYKGGTWFIELKAPGKKPRPIQISFSKELSKAGHQVEVLDTIEEVESFIRKISNA